MSEKLTYAQIAKLSKNKNKFNTVTHFSKKKIQILSEQKYRYNTAKVRKYGPYNKLNNIYTLRFSKSEIKTIYKILFNSNIKKYKKQFRYATVYDKDGKNIQINQNIRKSKKLIFKKGQSKYNTFCNWFHPLIKSKLLEYNSNEKIVDIKLLKHFDVLQYLKYGYFKPHRDDITTEEMIKLHYDGYFIYTLIICLSKNTNLPEDSGATSVWTNFNNVCILEGSRTYERHTFATGTRQGYAIVFPSNLLHSGNLCLGETYKLNINIAIKYKPEKTYSVLRTIPYACTTCLLHNKYGVYKINEQRKKLFYATKLPKTINSFSDVIIILISGFIGNFRQCHCIRKQESINNLKYGKCKVKNQCRCGCKTCGSDYDHNYCECNKCEYDREQEELWGNSGEDKYCNGHDY